jgi:hypothetical protein
VNANRRPIPAEILAAVRTGDMPLLVFADYAEESDWPAWYTNRLRSLDGKPQEAFAVWWLIRQMVLAAPPTGLDAETAEWLRLAPILPDPRFLIRPQLP